MDTVKDSFLDLERRRRQLEQNVAELQASLKHWQTWEAEYEGFKEELQALGDDALPTSIQATADDFEGELLTADEISKLVRDGKGNLRDSKQIQGLLSRRVDYVQENVKSAQKRYEAAGSKLAAVSIVMQPEARDEEGLPLTEITEELDEDDNIISSSLQHPGDAAPQILEALQKHGVKDLPELTPPESKATTQEGKSASTEPPPKSSIKPSSPTEERPKSHLKKIVSFAETSKPPAPSEAQGSVVENTTQRKQPRRSVHQDVVESLARDGLPAEPIIPAGETPEQIELRREMLQYSMNDIGSIVAEINLDEQDEEEFSYSEESEDEEDDEDNDEDQFGRTGVRILSDDYRQQMLDLERKLNAKSLVNAGPNIDEATVWSPNNNPTDNEDVDAETSREKKNVRFAENLDIREAPPSAKEVAAPRMQEAKDAPLADTIIERTSVVQTAPTPTAKPKKVSAFKAGRANQNDTPRETVPKEPAQSVTNGPLAGMQNIHLTSAVDTQRKNAPIIIPEPTRIVPEGPPGRPLSGKLIERPMTEASDSVEEPDELDPHLMHQEIAVKYHESRNRMIQRNGGFVRPEEEDPNPSGPRVSRFKAAKLAKVAK